MIRTASTAAAMALLTAPFAATAEESRELGAHQHGHGSLNIALDGDTLAMELEAPGADIVGFEHPAESDADQAAIDAAIATLSDPLALFATPAGAGCAVASVEVALIAEMEEHDDHDGHDHDDHDDHDHEKHAEKDDDHDHDEHADDEHAHDEDDHEEHADKDHDDHDEHADEETHTEFHAEYTLTCADPSAIGAIDMAYFATFENAQELDVQFLGAKGAFGFEVERDAPVLDLSKAL